MAARLPAERIFCPISIFEAAAKAGREKIGHPGTHNGNPLSAAAGIAALEIVAGTSACERANESGEALRRMLNQVLADEKVPWSIYGEFSGLNLFTNPNDRQVLPLEFDPARIDPSELAGNDPVLVGLVRLAMLINGVDVTPRFSGWISAVPRGSGPAANRRGVPADDRHAEEGIRDSGLKFAWRANVGGGG